MRDIATVFRGKHPIRAIPNIMVAAARKAKDSWRRPDGITFNVTVIRDRPIMNRVAPTIRRFFEGLQRVVNAIHLTQQQSRGITKYSTYNWSSRLLRILSPTLDRTKAHKKRHVVSIYRGGV